LISYSPKPKRNILPLQTLKGFTEHQKLLFFFCRNFIFPTSLSHLGTDKIWFNVVTGREILVWDGNRLSSWQKSLILHIIQMKYNPLATGKHLSFSYSPFTCKLRLTIANSCKRQQDAAGCPSPSLKE